MLVEEGAAGPREGFGDGAGAGAGELPAPFVRLSAGRESKVQ